MGKKRFAALFALLAMVVLFCPVVAFADDGSLQATSLQVQDGGSDSLPEDLGNSGYKLYLDDSDADWVMYYVDGENGTVMPTVVLKYNDRDVPDSLYKLVWRHTWYDDEGGRSRSEDVTDQVAADNGLKLIGAREDGRYTGIGDEYAVVAVPAEDSDFEHESAEVEIGVCDVHAIGGKDVSVVGGVETMVVPHRGYQCKISAADAANAAVVVKDAAVNSQKEPLNPSTDYEITYYTRQPGPYNNLTDDKWREVWSRENATTTFPTTPGTYWAEIKAKDGSDYVGATEMSFDVVDADVWFDDFGGEPLYSDGEKQLGLRRVGAGTLSLIIGKLNEQGTEWALQLEQGADKDYTFVEQTGLITLNGTKVFEKLAQAHMGGWLRLQATLTNGANVVSCDEFVTVRESVYDYGFDNERHMLIGDEGDIDVEGNVYVENANYQGDCDYEVTSVEVTGQNPNEPGKNVIRLEQDGDCWRYEALNYGTATLTITYNNPDEIAAIKGETGTYTFTVHVSSDVYELDVRSDNGSLIALPGKSINLTASCEHRRDESSTLDQEAFTYEWTVVDGEEFVKNGAVVVDPNDSSKATVTFNSVNGEGEINENVYVKCTVKGTGDAERDSQVTELRVASAYTELWPTENDHELTIGGQEEFSIELRRYPGVNGEGYSNIANDAELYWEGIDDESIAVFDSKGNPVGPYENLTDTKYTVKRLNGWVTHFRLVAEWEDGWTDREFWYDGIDTDIQLDSNVDKVFNDGTLDVRLDIDEKLDARNVNYTVGLWNGELNGGEGGWESTLTAGSGYTVSADNKTVTLNGAALLALGTVEDSMWVRVYAELKAGDEVISNADRWIQVRKVTPNYSMEDDCTLLPGWSRQINAKNTVHVENTAHPDGVDLDYSVTGVEVTSSDPSSGVISEPQKKTEPGSEFWEYTANSFGRATVKVTYSKPVELGGGIGSYEFNVNVSSDVYELNVSVENDGSFQAGPGQSITLVATAAHKRMVEGAEQAVELENPSYQWRLRDDGNEFATITPDAENPSKATVTFDALTDSGDGVDEDIWAEVELFEGSDSRASNDIRLVLFAEGINNLDFRFPSNDYAESDGSWALVFVSGREATVTPPFALYKGDTPVDPSKYTVSYHHMWREPDGHGNDEPKDEYLPGGSAVGAPHGQDEYALAITANTGSGYVGMYTKYGDEPTVCVVDKLNLDTSYTDMYFKDVDGVYDDRVNGMNPNYHVVPASKAAKYMRSLKVRTGGAFDADENLHKGELLASGTDYAVSYYAVDKEVRTQNPLHITYAVEGKQPLEAMPTTAGSYFIKIDGKTPYYESNGILVDIYDDMKNVEVVAIPAQARTGSAIRPKLSVRYQGKELKEGVDYQVEYRNNTAAGQAEAVISGANPIMQWGHKENSPEVVWTPLDEDRFFAGKKTVTFNIVEPIWAQPTYVWSADNTTCTATRKSTNFPDLNQTETARATSAVTQAATQTAMGETTYTATFKNAAFTTQRKTVANIARLQPAPATPTTVAPTVAAPGTVVVSGSALFVVTSAGLNPEAAFAKSASAKTASIPATVTDANGVLYAVTSIAPSAFKGDKKLTKVVAGSNVVTINAAAFQNCSKLKSFTIGENVVNIGAGVCKGAKKLTKVTVKSGKLTKKAIKNLLKGSKIKTIKLSGPAAKAMKKQYQKWAGKKVKVK